MLVFDSSTLILLAKTELLDLLINDYQGVIVIPQEVEKESCRRKDSFDALLIAKRVEEKKIQVAKVRHSALCDKLMADFSIASGEAEAIALFQEKKAKILAVDDRNAIKACKVLGIPFASALAILVRLVERKVITVREARAKLLSLAICGRYRESTLKEAENRLNAVKEG